MKPGTSFDTQQARSILLLGETGTGKSSLAMRFPSPGFVLGDKNIRHAANWATAHNHTWHYADPLLDKDGKPVPPEHRWKRSKEILQEMGASPEVKTIVDDSLSHLTDFLKLALIKAGSMAEKPLVIGGETVMTKSLWEPFAINLKSRITDAKTWGKPYIMVAHVSVGDNEMSGAKEMQVAVQGQMRSELGRWFTDIWLCDAVPSSDAKYAKTRGIRYLVRMAATHRIKLKSSDDDLPAEMDVEELAEKLGLAA